MNFLPCEYCGRPAIDVDSFDCAGCGAPNARLLGLDYFTAHFTNTVFYTRISPDMVPCITTRMDAKP